MQPSLYLASPALERGVTANRELGIVQIKANLGGLPARINKPLHARSINLVLVEVW